MRNHLTRARCRGLEQLATDFPRSFRRWGISSGCLFIAPEYGLDLRVVGWWREMKLSRPVCTMSVGSINSMVVSSWSALQFSILNADQIDASR